MSRVALAFGLTSLVGCTQEDLAEPTVPRDLDEAYFVHEVQPALAARCAFPECHGNDRRPFRLYAVQRNRLDTPWQDQHRPLTDSELSANYDMARGVARPAEPLILLKPLSAEAGGYFHIGSDSPWGVTDVFMNTSDPAYCRLEAWVDRRTGNDECDTLTDLGP